MTCAHSPATNSQRNSAKKKTKASSLCLCKSKSKTANSTSKLSANPLSKNQLNKNNTQRKNPKNKTKTAKMKTAKPSARKKLTKAQTKRSTNQKKKTPRIKCETVRTKRKCSLKNAVSRTRPFQVTNSRESCQRNRLWERQASSETKRMGQKEMKRSVEMKQRRFAKARSIRTMIQPKFTMTPTTPTKLPTWFPKTKKSNCAKSSTPPSPSTK